MSRLIVPLWINGKEEIPGPTFDVISPQKNELCWKASNATPDDAIRAVEAAEAAFPRWSQTKPVVKQKILNRTVSTSTSPLIPSRDKAAINA